MIKQHRRLKKQIRRHIKTCGDSFIASLCETDIYAINGSSKPCIGSFKFFDMELSLNTKSVKYNFKDLKSKWERWN